MSVLSSISRLKTIVPVATVALGLGLASAPAFAQHGGGHGGGGGGGGGFHGGGGGGGHGGGGWHGGGWHGGGWHGGGWHGGWNHGWRGGWGFYGGFYPWYGYGGWGWDPFWAYGDDPYPYTAAPMDYGPGPEGGYPPPEGYGDQNYYPPATGQGGLPSDNTRGFYTWQLGIEGGTCNRPELQRYAVNLTGAQPASLTAGSVLGGIPVQRVIGGKIGPRLDVTDQACATEALEHARTGTTVRWETMSGIPITFQVTKTTENENRPACRDFVATAQFASQAQTVRGAACKGQDGAWRTTR